MRLLNILIITDKKAHSSMRITEKHLTQIKKAAGKNVVEIIDLTDKKISSYLEKTDILIPAVDLSSINLKTVKNIKWLHITSAGINLVPESILKSNIILTNSSGVHPIPITEQIFAYMLVFARSMYQTIKAQSQKKWLTHNDLRVFELHGRTILIVGLGRIGQEVARLAKAFNMNILAISRNPDKKMNQVDNIGDLKKLNKFVQEADFVINCLPGTTDTFQLFNMEIFKNMKKSAFFINIGRGFSVNEKDLIKALKKKIISGAALDVTEIEPLPNKSPLWTIDNVIITPHHAGWTPNYINRVVNIFCENLKSYLSKKPMPNLVDKKLGY